MATDMSILHLITGASAVVQIVMLILVVVSITSWTMIFHKWKMLQDARSEAEAFEKRFWSGGDLAVLYKEVADGSDEARGMADIFEAGFKEFARLRKQSGNDAQALIEGVQRCMRVALSREMDRSGNESAVSRHGRLDQSVCRSVRYGVGHHEFLPCAG